MLKHRLIVHVSKIPQFQYFDIEHESLGRITRSNSKTCAITKMDVGEDKYYLVLGELKRDEW